MTCWSSCPSATDMRAIQDGNCLRDGDVVEYEEAWDDRKGKYMADAVTGGMTEDDRKGGGGGGRDGGRDRYDDRRGGGRDDDRRGGGGRDYDDRRGGGGRDYDDRRGGRDDYDRRDRY